MVGSCFRRLGAQIFCDWKTSRIALILNIPSQGCCQPNPVHEQMGLPVYWLRKWFTWHMPLCGDACMKSTLTVPNSTHLEHWRREELRICWSFIELWTYDVYQSRQQSDVAVNHGWLKGRRTLKRGLDFTIWRVCLVEENFSSYTSWRLECQFTLVSKRNMWEVRGNNPEMYLDQPLTASHTSFGQQDTYLAEKILLPMVWPPNFLPSLFLRLTRLYKSGKLEVNHQLIQVNSSNHTSSSWRWANQSMRNMPSAIKM